MRIADIASLHGGHYPTRPIDTTSGWFFCGQSDVERVHIYAMPVRVQPVDKPIVLSEFGGYAYKAPDHSFNPYATYSYSLYPTQEAFRRALEDLYTARRSCPRGTTACAPPFIPSSRTWRTRSTAL